MKPATAPPESVPWLLSVAVASASAAYCCGGSSLAPRLRLVCDDGALVPVFIYCTQREGRHPSLGN